MTTYLLGSPVPISISVRQSGTLVDPSTISLEVRKPPDATPVTYAYNPGAIVRDSLGVYHLDVPASTANAIGRYPYAWTTTGPGAGVVAGSFDIRDPFDVYVLPLQDAKDMLNIPQATTTYDDEIQSWLDTITASLERMSGGPIVNRTVVERVSATAAAGALCVRSRPLVSVTSVVDTGGGSTLSISDIEIDTNAGVIRKKLGVPWLGTSDVYTVTYVAGWGTSVPASFTAAARIIIDHLWATQHGPSSRPALGDPDMTTLTGWGYAIPNRAAELLAPYVVEAFV